MQDITPFLPGDTIAYLRLADSERRFPFRPVAQGLFLIGQGPACDLRLGLENLPALHSVIQADSKKVEIQRLAESPELIVNGEPVDQAKLHHGDLIEIADVRVVFYSCSPVSLAVCPEAANASTMSTRQIVEGLESELHLISADATRRDKIQELLKAAQQAVDACQFAQTIRFADYAPKPASADDDGAAQFRTLVLSRLTSQETRLDEICNVLEQVVNQQQMIATALQCVAERLDEMQSGTHSSTRRASA